MDGDDADLDGLASADARIGGRFPLPGAGPFTLLEESEANHWGKMAFRWVYWNVLLPGYDIPGVGAHMSMLGKVPLGATK